MKSSKKSTAITGIQEYQENMDIFSLFKKIWAKVNIKIEVKNIYFLQITISENSNQ